MKETSSLSLTLIWFISEPTAPCSRELLVYLSLSLSLFTVYIWISWMQETYPISFTDMIHILIHTPKECSRHLAVLLSSLKIFFILIYSLSLMDEGNLTLFLLWYDPYLNPPLQVQEKFWFIFLSLSLFTVYIWISWMKETYPISFTDMIHILIQTPKGEV